MYNTDKRWEGLGIPSEGCRKNEAGALAKQFKASCLGREEVMASIRKRKWRTPKGEARVAWMVDFTDDAGNRDRKQFESKPQADAFRIKMEGELQTGSYRADAARVTVKDAADLFLIYCHGRMERRERMTRRNYAVYEGHVHNYICPDQKRHADPHRARLTAFDKGIGGTRLRELTAGKVERFCDHLKEAGITIPTIRKILGTLKLLLRHAVSRDLVAMNVARDVKVIGRRDQASKRIVPPTKEAMKQLIAAADSDFSVKLIVASATGARAGEFHALRWRHLNLVRGEVKIGTRVNAHGEEDVTKTTAGMRDVPLGAHVVAVLKAWKLRSRFARPHDLVFPNRRGGYVNHDNMVKRKFHKLFDTLDAKHAKDPDEHAAPPARFNWHALRHFAISCWIDAGLSPKTVQTFAGHSSLQVTMDRYGHLFKSDDHRKAMDKIAKQMFSA
jgi:integrase